MCACLHGTYMEFRTLKKAEAEKKRKAREGGESLTVVPEGQYKKFDEDVFVKETPFYGRP